MPSLFFSGQPTLAPTYTHAGTLDDVRTALRELQQEQNETAFTRHRVVHDLLTKVAEKTDTLEAVVAELVKKNESLESTVRTLLEGRADNNVVEGNRRGAAATTTGSDDALQVRGKRKSLLHAHLHTRARERAR